MTTPSTSPPQQPGWAPAGAPVPGYSPAPAPAARKRRRWPWVIAGIVVVFFIIGIAAGGGEQAPSGNGGPAAGDSPAADSGTVYEITGQGADTASITYVTNSQINQAQENGAALPWTKTVQLGDGFFNYSSVVAQVGEGVTSITCRISQGGKVLVENTSTGPYAVVTCSGT